MLTIGPKVTHVEFDENIFQGGDPICAIRCQEIILRDFGIHIPKEELTTYAKEQGWYSGKGTKPSDIGNLLETCDISIHSQKNASVTDLINELKEGHRVIVNVDSRELKAKAGSKEHEFYSKLERADHALIVTSVNVDPEHPENSTVVLTDPGTGSIVEYNFEHFAHAWKDSKCFMMATDEPAPYQYNAEDKCMEYSNFATEFSIKEYPFHNDFTDIWQVDKLGYVPYYKDGHCINLTDDLLYGKCTDGYNNEELDHLHVNESHNSYEQIGYIEQDVINGTMLSDNTIDLSLETDDNIILDDKDYYF